MRTFSLYIFTLFFLINFVIKGFAQDNLTVINNLLYKILDDTVFNNKISEKDSIAIVITNFHNEEKSYILLNLGKVLLEKSLTVFRNFIPADSFQGLVLEINHFSVDVTYSKPYSKKLIGDRYCKRKIVINLEGQLFDNESKQILYSIIKTSEDEDEIEYKRIDNLEKSSYSFTIGQRSGYSVWQRIFEPVLVISSCAVIIYIFFTKRV